MAQPYYVNSGVPQPSGLNVTVAQPIDVRTVVRLRSELIDPDT